MTCEQCREQILPYLYDLLEPLEKAALAAHVETCASCQDALKLAREQVGLLAEAVKAPNEAIVFQSPVQATPAETASTRPFNPAPTPRLFLLNRWTMAASILVAVFSIGAVLGGMSWRDQRQAESAASDRLARAKLDLENARRDLNNRKDQAQAEVRVIQKQIDAFVFNWKKDEAETRNKLDKDRVQMNVKGPRNAIGGAPNNYEFEMTPEAISNLMQNPNFKGQTQQNKAQQLPQLNARVFNQKTNEIVFQKQIQFNPINNRANLDIPPDFPINPHDDLMLEVETLDPEGKVVVVREYLKLVSPEFVTHLATDRPMYRPGDTVRFRSLTLDRFSLTPTRQEFHLRYRIVNWKDEEIFSKEVADQFVINKKKEPLKGPEGHLLRGVGADEFALPADLPEGHYTLSVSEVNERFNEERRPFQVRRLQTPRFHKEVTFHRPVYTPGDVVKMRVRVTPLVGAAAPVAVARISAVMNVDGRAINSNQPGPGGQGDVRFDKDGAVADFEFTLPNVLQRGICTVTITCDDNTPAGDRTVRTVPIFMRDMMVDFYPEGGELVAGVPNRVYFQARTLAGKPADFEGVIVDDRRQEIARIQTLTDEREPGINQGLGSFTFTPQAKRRYSLKIESPIGIDRQMNLPAVKPTGVVLHVPQGVVDNEINVVLHSAREERDLLVGAYCRGRMLDHKVVKADPARPIELTLRPQVPVGGVYRITVFEKIHKDGAIQFRPVAERLVYRKNQAHVDVAIESTRPSYQPGDSVELRFQARNEKHEIVPSIAMIAVFDSNVAKIADDRTNRAMPTHFLLTTEVRGPEDLENADVLLGNHPKATMALDLLLGAQGWRRFAEQDPSQFTQRQQQQKAPLFLANALTAPQQLESDRKHLEKLDQGYVAKAIALNKELAVKEKTEADPRELQFAVLMCEQVVQAAENEVSIANLRVRETRAFVTQFTLGGILLTLLFIGFFFISTGLRRLTEGGNARPWLFIGIALLALLFLASIVGTFALMGDPMFEDLHGRNNALNLNAGAPLRQKEDVADLILPLPDEGTTNNEDPDGPAAPVQKAPRNPEQPREQQNFIGNEDQAKNWQNNDQVVVQRQQQVDVQVDLRTLRQQGNYQAVLERQLGRRVLLPPAQDVCLVREYAHQRHAPKDEAQRDFTETVYWHPVLVMEDGAAAVQFDLSDAVTRYEVVVLSHTIDGRLGANRAEFAAQLPIRINPQAPAEVTETDQLSMPIALENGTSRDVAATILTRGKGWNVVAPAERAVQIAGDDFRREIVHVQPSIREGEAALRIIGKTSGFTGAVDRRIKIVPEGYPVSKSVGGVLENGGVEHTIELPDQWVAGTLQVHAYLYPSGLAEIQGALESMKRAPAGCFEQNASLNFANVMILQWLKQAGQSGPTNYLAEKHARGFLQSNSATFAAFESIDPVNPGQKGGFGLFGNSTSPNTALTAYSALQLRALAKLQRTDSNLIERTDQFLLNQRSQGGRVGKKIDPLVDAYIVWALTENNVPEDLNADLAALQSDSKISKDPYFLALAALSHLNRKKTAEGLALVRQMSAFQDNEGQVAGAASSVTGSQGRDLVIETTALAILAWTKADRPLEFAGNLDRAVKWLGRQRRDQGSYGGTQATLLALKAMLAQKSPRQIQGGEVSIFLRNAPPPNDIRAIEELIPADFDQHRAVLRGQEMITLRIPDPNVLAPGKNVIRLDVAAGNTVPYTLTWSYRTAKLPKNAEAPVKLAARLSKTQATEGETVKLNAILENVSSKAQGMTVAILGLPAGLALPEDRAQINALTNNPIAAWEVRGRDLVLYWRDLPANAKVSVAVDLTCTLPGAYQGPASRAYPYYDADNKHWIEPLHMRIAARK